MAEDRTEAVWALPAWVTARGPRLTKSEAVKRQRRAWNDRDRARAPLTRSVRMRLIDQADARCAYCGEQGTADPWWDSRGPDGRLWHFDHRVPLSRGGSVDLSNVALACATCNGQKHTMTDVEFIAFRG